MLIRPLVCAFLLCGVATAQVAVDNSGTNSNSTPGKTATCTIPSISANSLVLFVLPVDDDGTTTFNTPTATGLTFVQIGSAVHNTNNYYAVIYRAYTSSALGSTVITGTWNTTNNDWNAACVSLSGTAGTSGNNGSDAIGNTSLVDSGTTASPTTTVTSSGHNNSKYFGAIIYADSNLDTITPGTGYSTVTARVFNSSFIGMATELSTNPVTPAGNTVVNGTINVSKPTALLAVEILVAGVAGTTRRRALVISR